MLAPEVVKVNVSTADIVNAPVVASRPVTVAVTSSFVPAPPTTESSLFSDDPNASVESLVANLAAILSALTVATNLPTRAEASIEVNAPLLIEPIVKSASPVTLSVVADVAVRASRSFKVTVELFVDVRLTVSKLATSTKSTP